MLLPSAVSALFTILLTKSSPPLPIAQNGRYYIVWKMVHRYEGKISIGETTSVSENALKNNSIHSYSSWNCKRKS